MPRAVSCGRPGTGAGARARARAAAGVTAGAEGVAATTHGVGAACPIVNDSLMVALNDSVMEKNSTLTDSEIETPASKLTSIG